jgi:hypothetical protein
MLTQQINQRENRHRKIQNPSWTDGAQISTADERGIDPLDFQRHHK